MFHRNLRTLVVASAVCLMLGAVPAKASLIQDFVLNDNGCCGVSGSGTVTFDGLGNIADLDISGTFGSLSFDLQNLTGTGTVDSNWNGTSWDFFVRADINRPNGGRNGYILQLQPHATANPGLLGITCFDDLESCQAATGIRHGGLSNVGVIFTPRHVPEPLGLALLALTGLVLARRRSWLH